MVNSVVNKSSAVALDTASPIEAVKTEAASNATKVKPLGKITEQEMQHALGQSDPVFKRYLESHVHHPVKTQWIADLTRVINQRADDNPGKTPGVDLVMRFPAAYYPKIGHVALAAMWRDGDDKAKLAFLHQESIPVLKEDGKIAGFKGQVFSNFDTGAHFKDGKAPVETSINTYGPPDIMVSHCPHPEKILDLQALTKGVDHPYGAFGASDASGFTPLTCFSITQSAREALQTGVAEMDIRATIPHIAKDMAQRGVIGGTSYDKLRHFPVKDKKSGAVQIVDLEAPGLSAKTLTGAFVKIGEEWGSHDHVAWHVKPSSRMALNARL